MSTPLGKRLTVLDQIAMTRHLGTILNTGTDLMGGLEIIGRDAIKPMVRRIIYDIKSRISRGQKFSEALASWKGQFNPVFISLVRAGESSGNLPGILLAYAQELRKDYAFSRKLRGALVYPVILIAALMGMVVLILTVVIPRLKEVFASTKINPPVYTKFFFFISDFLLAHVVSIIVVFGVLLLVVFVLLQNNKTRRHMATLLWYLPFLNKIQKNITLNRFSKTLATLIDAGFTLQQGLVITGEVTGKKYELVLKSIARDKLEQGVLFSQALAEHKKYFPAIMVSVIATGEKSGQLSQVLKQMAEFYEEEVAYSLELFLTLIEPILLVVVGVIVALVASSLILPLYQLIGKIR
jgi:type II secretory pathway component PulF